MIRFMIPLAGALALSIWWGMNERDARKAAEADLRGAEVVIEVTSKYVSQLIEIEGNLSDQIGELSNVPDTQTCGPSIGAALDQLREN